MRYKIVGDSCCDLTAEDLKKEYYVSVPLTLTVGDTDVLDDENFDLQCFIGKELIQTSSVSRGRMIKGRWYENTGLKRNHVRQAIKMLNGE